MIIANNTILECKKSLDNYLIIKNNRYSIGYYLQTDTSKDICEDALLVRSDNGRLMLAICDGVGGSDRSYRAAKNTLSHIAELPLDISIDDLNKELVEINNKLIALEGSPQTTLTLAVINKNEYHCIQVGDSGLLQCSNHGNLKYKSNIHSPVGKALAEKKLTEQQALEDPELHVVDNVLGCIDFYVDISEPQEISVNDTLLLTSDGILDNFLTKELVDIICKGTTEEVSSKITALSKSQENPFNNKPFYKLDDISYICVKHL